VAHDRNTGSPGPRAGRGPRQRPAAGFATGKPLDIAPGGATLASFLEEVAGDDDRYPGATDDELLGAICASDRAEAAMAAGKHAAARS